MCMRACECVWECVRACTKCEQSLWVRNLQGLCRRSASVCLTFLYVIVGLSVCVCVCRISLCVCAFVTASVQVHGEMLFTASSAARLHDGSQHRGG